MMTYRTSTIWHLLSIYLNGRILSSFVKAFFINEIEGNMCCLVFPFGFSFICVNFVYSLWFLTLTICLILFSDDFSVRSICQPMLFLIFMVFLLYFLLCCLAHINEIFLDFQCWVCLDRYLESLFSVKNTLSDAITAITTKHYVRIKSSPTLFPMNSSQLQSWTVRKKFQNMGEAVTEFPGGTTFQMAPWNVVLTSSET